jgi:putative transposase
VRPVRQRKLVDEMRGEWDVSIRRACRVFEVDTSTYHYKSRRPGQATPIMLLNHDGAASPPS